MHTACKIAAAISLHNAVRFHTVANSKKGWNRSRAKDSSSLAGSGTKVMHLLNQMNVRCQTVPVQPTTTEIESRFCWI